ncbi:MAG: PAS domain S-box protein, partial [bacterium]
GKIVVWNKGAEKMSGIKRSAVVGRKLPGVLALGESDSARISEENLSKAFLQLARRSGTKQRKKRFAAAGSVSKITDEAGHLLGTTGVAFDLTELRLAERSARESQKLLQTILDSIDDLVAMTGEGRRLIFTNKAIEKLTGFTTRDLQQAGPPPYHNMMLDKEKARVDAQWQKLLSSSRPGTIELPIPTKEGKDRLVEWKTIRIEDKKEKRFGVVSVGRDMTERIKAEKESELLLDLSASLGKTLELAKTLAEALEKTMHVFGADAGLIAGLEKKTGRLNMLAHKGMEPEIVSKLEQRRASNGWTATVIKTRRPLVVEDIRKSPYRAEAYTEAIRAGYRSFMSLPLIFKNEVFGVFEMASTQKSQFSTSDLNLCASIANILSSAVHNAILHNELAKRQKELTELSRKLSSAEEDERKRISAELHDEAAQLLVAARANMALAAKQLGKSNPKARRTLRETTELISHALDQVRDICHGLHPALLDDIGLSGAVRWLAKNTARTSGVQVRVNSSGLKERLPGPVEASLFRIVQETLNNIARHSKADRAAVNISRSDSQIKITIKDNGVGFDTERECKAPKGLGLRTLAQRVRWLGGELRLESDRGKGTLVEIQIPMEGHRNEKD